MFQQFKRSSRLHQSKDFTRIFRTGRRFKRHCLMVYTSPKPMMDVRNESSHAPNAQLGLPVEKSGSRIGVVVPKKAVALATSRHRLKRIIRESFRLNQTRLTNLDVVILMMRGIPCDEKRLWQTLEQIWQELQI